MHTLKLDSNFSSNWIFMFLCQWTQRVLRLWILNVGDGNIGENNDGEVEIEISYDMLIKNSGDPIASIVDSTYPSMLESMSYLSFFQSMAILAPTNDIVDSLNNYILSINLVRKKRT